MFQTDESTVARPVPAHVLEACKPLIEERRNSTIAFIHISVKEYVVYPLELKAGIDIIISYLQSGDCSTSIRLEEGSIRWDHGLASLRCVRSAFDVFGPGFPRNLRQVQVIRGVWGFVPYATEFWAVDLQELTVPPTEKWDCRLISIASDLSTVLAKSRPGPEAIPPGQSFEGLEGIRQFFPNLWCDATLSLQARASGQHRTGGSNLAGKFLLQSQTPLTFTTSLPPH